VTENGDLRGPLGGGTSLPENWNTSSFPKCAYL